MVLTTDCTGNVFMWELVGWLLYWDKLTLAMFSQ